MKVVKYEIDKNILTVGFAENDFIVYTQLAYNATKTKQELLQKAYEQCKSAIDYEKTQEEHAFEWDGKGGEDFTPALPKAKSIELILDKSYVQFEAGQETAEIALSADVKDQYGDNYIGNIEFSTIYGNISENTLIIPSVTEYTEAVIAAEIEGISNIKTIQLFPYVESQIVDEHVDKEIIAMAEAIIDFDNRLRVLEERG